MQQHSTGRKNKVSQNSSAKSMHKRECLVVPVLAAPKTNENMREVSIKLMAIMKAKKECNIT